jgi:hypothetical protein
VAPKQPRNAVPVYLEVGRKRVFAAAAEWPGWCRQGSGEQAAIEALAGAARRYAAVPKAAGIPFPRSDVFDIVERLPGDATTDFGAPGAIAKSEAKPLNGKELERVRALVAASWEVFERIAAKAPAELRKGPRGGGRDRDAIVEHVLDAESAYAPKIGVRLKRPPSSDRAAVRAFRDAILEAFLEPGADSTGAARRWPARYTARRIAWHALDHAWEIEDRSER